MQRPPILRTALVLGGLLLAACGGDDGGDAAGGPGNGNGNGGSDLPPCPVDALEAAAADGPVEVTFWHGMGGADVARSLEAVTDAYNASQDQVRVTLLNQQSYEQNFENFRTATPQDRPDIVQLPEYYLQAMADSGTALPVEACVEASGFDTEALLDAADEYYRIDGTLQAMPFNVSNPVLYYNKAMFEAAGLDPNDPPTTFEELRQYSQAIVDSGAATYGIALETGFDSGGGWGIEQWLASMGEPYADNGNGREGRATEVLFDGEAGVEILTFLQGLVQDGLAVNVGENASGTDGLFKLADAEEPAAMTLYSSAAISSVLNALDGGLVPGFGPEQLGIGPLPSPGEVGVTVGGAALWVVEDNPDEVIAAAWDYIEYLVSAETQSTWSVGTGYVPVNEGSIDLPPLSDTVAADPRFRVAYDQLVNTDPSVAAGAGPVLGPLRQIRGEVADAVQAVLSGGADPAEALAQAAEAADAHLADYASRTGTG